MIQDVRFGFRMLLRTPGFSPLALFCLTLGIGANTSVFSWIEGILLRPFPAVANQDRLFVLGETARGATRVSSVSWPDFLDLQKSCSLIDAFISDRLVATTLSIGQAGNIATHIAILELERQASKRKLSMRMVTLDCFSAPVGQGPSI